MSKKIELILVERGLKKGWLAEQAGISRSTLTNILKGASPTLPVALRIAKVLDTTVEELWGHLIKK